MVELQVDDSTIKAPQGKTLLAACLENGIYIPHLCFMEDDERPAASCRLCFVEIEGVQAPVPACTVDVDSGLRVRTGTPAVRRLQRSALRLLLSVHDVDCKHCHANRACELQNIARFLTVALKSDPLERIARSTEVDQRHPCIDHYPHRCVLCGKCLRVHRQHHARPAFSFIGRGIDLVIQHYPTDDQSGEECQECRKCIDVCPVGALAMRETLTLATHTIDS